MVPGSSPAVVRTKVVTTSVAKNYVSDAVQKPIYTGRKDTMSYFMMPSMDIFHQSVNSHTKLIVKV